VKKSVLLQLRPQQIPRPGAETASLRPSTNLQDISFEHTDFNSPYVNDVIHERINKHHNKLEAHPTPLLGPLLQPVNSRRLKL